MNDRIWSKNFIFLILCNFLMYIIYYAILSALPVYLVTVLKASSVEVGVVVGVYTVASVAVRPFSGFVLDRYGRRTIFLLGLIIYTFLVGGYLVALTLIPIFLLRIAQGLVWAFTTVSGSTIAVDIIPPSRRGEGIGYFALSTTLGMSVGPVIGLFAAHHWGYTVMFVSGCMTGVASLAFAASIHLRRRYLLGKRIRFEWSSLFERNSVVPSLNVMITMTAYGGLMSFIALFGREIGIANSSLYFLIFSIGIASSRIISGKVLDKKGPRRILTICMLLLVAGYPLLSIAKNEWLFYFSAVIIGFGNGVIFPAFQSMVNNIAEPDRRGSANSTLYTAVDLGMGLGMIFAGLIAQHFSFAAIFRVNALLCIAGLVFFRMAVIGFYEKRMSSI